MYPATFHLKHKEDKTQSKATKKDKTLCKHASKRKLKKADINNDKLEKEIANLFRNGSNSDSDA